MAKRVRLGLVKKGVGSILLGKDNDPRLDGFMSSVADQVQRKMEADPNLGGATVNRRDWVGFDRMRKTMGVPGSIEARHGVGSRALGSTRG